jgi:hypothetical protein
MDSRDDALSELENYLDNSLQDKYLIFTSKINFLCYRNNVKELIS